MSDKLKRNIKNIIDPQNFGERLYVACGRGTYQQAHAFLREKGIKLDYDTIRKYLLGQREPDMTTIIKLSRATNAKIEWLLTGEGDSGLNTTLTPVNGVSPSISESKLFWNLFELDEFEAIKNLAVAEQLPVERFMHNIMIQALQLTNSLTNPTEIKTFISNCTNQSDADLTEIKLNYKVKNDGELEDISNKKKTEMLKVPQNWFPDFFVGSSRMIHPSMAQGYQIETDEMESEGIMRGDVIVCGNILNGNSKKVRLEEAGQPVLIKGDNHRRVYFRRIYQNPFQIEKFMFRPFRQLRPIEQILRLNKSDVEIVYGILIGRQQD